MHSSVTVHIDRALGAGIDRLLYSTASLKTKVVWLRDLETTIIRMWEHGLTSVKPVMFMTEDDLVQ
jgi:hypothetical protein